MSKTVHLLEIMLHDLDKRKKELMLEREYISGQIAAIEIMALGLAKNIDNVRGEENEG